MSTTGATNSTCDSLETSLEIHLERLQLVGNKKIVKERSINNKKFFIAISESNIELVHSLLKKIDINFKDENGCSPLHWAVEAGDTKIIELLVSNGAHLHIKNNDLKTPIDIAKQMNRLDIVNILDAYLNAVDNSQITETRETPDSNQKLSPQDPEVWINPVHGYIYQLKVLMLFLHRGLSYKYSFRLGTEIKEAKKFDDLIFEYTHENKKVYRLLQAKHKFDESKKITVYKLLTETKGDYSLIKYFYSFKGCMENNFFKDGTIKDVIICTNIDFDWDNLNKSGIEMKKVEEKDDILDIKSSEKQSMRYKFTNSVIRKLKPVLKPGESDDDIKHFLNHLVFAVNQPNEEELGQIVKKEIGREMGFLDSENAYNNLLIKMMDLSLGKRNSMFLSHKDGEKLFDDLKTEIPIWFNTQHPVSSFTGRLEYLDKMHEILTKNLCVCISGTGGVGKSELVRKYIADYGHEYDDHVVWINAESYRSAADSFRQLASDKLNINLDSSNGKEKHLTTIAADVYQFFSKSKSLFIFDNAEKYRCENESDWGIEQLLPCLPKSCIKPNIIITSRNQKWPKSIEIIVLEAFTAEEARILVKKMLIFENDEQKALIDELSEKLQYLPLALQQAIAYIKMQNEKLEFIGSKFGINDYLEKYSNMAHELLDFKFSEVSDSKYDKSVLATWNITFDALEHKENGRDALGILNIISYFLPDNISIDLLLKFTDKETLSLAIGLLKQYSIVSVQHKEVSVHRLVQQVTRIKLQKVNAEVMVLRRTLDLLSNEDINFKNIDHLISLWTFSSKHSHLLERCAIFSSGMIKELSDWGRFQEAVSIGNQASALMEKIGKIDAETLSCLFAIKNNVAMCSLNNGEYQKALEEFEEIYEPQKTVLGPTDDHVLILKGNIGSALENLGRYEDALECYYEMLGQYRVNLKENHSNILLTKSRIVALLSKMGNPEEALSMLHDIYDMQKGTCNTKTFTTRYNIAIALGNLKKNEESLKVFEELCRDEEAVLPKNHPSILKTKSKIAFSLAAQRKFSAAIKIYQELFHIMNERFGEDHPDVVDINVSIGTILKFQGEYKKALKIVKSSLAKQQAIFGLTHPTVFQTQCLMAEVLAAQKKYADALKIYKDLLDKQLPVLGNNHPSTLKTREFMLSMLMNQNNYRAALECSLEVLHTQESMFGKDHPSTFATRNSLAMMYLWTGEWDKALDILRQLLQIEERLLAKDHIDYQTTLSIIASVMEKQAGFIQGGNDIYFEQLTDKAAFVNAKDAEGRTMLHNALMTVNEAQVKLLLERGAEIFVTSNKGNTPLHIAVLKGQERLVNLLLRKLKPERLNDFVDVKTTSSGTTALHVAAQKGYFGIVKCLLKNHATFCAKNKDGKTPLDLSTDVKVTSLLKMAHELFEGLKQAADVIRKLEKLSTEELLAVTNTRDDRGSTLSQVAILNKHKKVAAQILRMVQESKPK